MLQCFTGKPRVVTLWPVAYASHSASSCAETSSAACAVAIRALADATTTSRRARARFTASGRPRRSPWRAGGCNRTHGQQRTLPRQRWGALWARQWAAGHDEIVRAKDTAQGGVEPPTLRLTATRSNQLSYQAFCLEATGQNLGTQTQWAGGACPLDFRPGFHTPDSPGRPAMPMTATLVGVACTSAGAVGWRAMRGSEDESAAPLALPPARVLAAEFTDGSSIRGLPCW